jgi:UDP-4-amino-4,6-dideoxy-N-acetyl-beta-L-altrosamine N-acetyltransferase
MNYNTIIQLEEYILTNFTLLSLDVHKMILKWRNNDNVRKWVYNDDIITELQHFSFIESLKQDKTKLYYLVTGPQNYIGVISFTNISFKHRRATFGIYANPEEKIDGAGKILNSLALEFAFNILNLHTLKLEVLETNLKAYNSYLKVGYQEEGRLRDYVYKDGKWLDVIVMGIINPKEIQVD